MPPFKLYSTAPDAPLAVAVSVVVPPLHAIVPAAAETERLHCAAQLTIVCVVAVHPFASVTVKPYVPFVLANVPVPVYGAVPPLALTVTVDVPATHAEFAADAISCVGCVTVADVVAVQPSASVTVKVNVPAVLENVPVPVYGAVPPLAETVTVELPPLHEIDVCCSDAISCVGCVIAADTVDVQLFASVTVNVYVPAVLEKVPVPVYGAAPPVALTVTVELPPLQEMLVCCSDGTSGAG